MREHDARRAFLAASGASLLLAACGGAGQAQASSPAASPAGAAGKGEDVGAVEDLMREHGVIRRVLVIYREAASRLRTKPADVPPDALQKAATLMRSFGWKKLFTPQQLDEIGDRFEDIEHRTFGKDGFDDAVEQVGAIEKVLGIELAALTAPPPM